MTTQQLRDICKRHGLKIDRHPGREGFGDLTIGCGATWRELDACRRAIRADAPWAMLTLRRVNVQEHEQYGQWYLEFASFWWDEANEVDSRA